jgi:hypothetical protein
MMLMMIETVMLLYSSIPPEGTAALPYALAKQWVQKYFGFIVNAMVLNEATQPPCPQPPLLPSVLEQSIFTSQS